MTVFCLLLLGGTTVCTEVDHSAPVAVVVAEEEAVCGRGSTYPTTVPSMPVGLERT